MDKTRYGGRDFDEAELRYIQRLVEQSPQLSRAALSRIVCEHLNWRQQNGDLKGVRCRVAMIEMDKAGLLQLPAPRTLSPALRNNAIAHTEKTQVSPNIECPVHQLSDLSLEIVGAKDTSLWNEFIDRYHYLGHKTLPGAQMRFIARANNQIIACLGFGAAAWKTAGRDRYIGWSAEARAKNLYRVVNNARFLILPWIHSPNLASKLLSLSAKYIQNHWFDRYGYQPVLLETFVELPRFTGHCYKAANWIHVRRTTGRGKMSRDHKVTMPKKDIWLYPLQKNFKHILQKM